MAAFRSCALALALLCGASAAFGQFSQYTPAGDFERSPVTVKAQLDEAVDNAKWDLGRVRADPWLALREVTYDDNVGVRAQNPRSDFTATIGAGVRAYLPFAGDVILAGHLLPEYVWWQELSERRRVNGRAGVGLFGTAGRTAFEASVSRADEARFFSREFEDQVNTRDEVGLLSLEVDLDLGFSLFGSGRLRRLEFRDEDPDVQDVKTLDREETIYRGGIRYNFERGLSIGVDVEDSEVEFERVGNIRSNSGSSPLVQIEYTTPDVFIGIEAIARELEFPQAPTQLDFDEITGSVRAEWTTSERLSPQLWGRRDLVYSFSDRWAYYDESTVGAGLKAAVSSWLGVRIYGETGTADYRAIDPATPVRDEDFDSYGIAFQFEVNRSTFHLEFSTTDYKSSLPEFDRDFLVIRTGLVFGSRTVSPWG